MTQMSLIKSTTAVRLMEPLITPSPHKPYFILDQPIEDETDIPPTSTSIEQISTIVSFSKIILIVLTSLIISILLWVTFKIFILPLFYKSNICRQLCISCLYNSHTQQSPTTDIFLEVVHIQSGKQTRIFLTTITTPASSRRQISSLISSHELGKTPQRHHRLDTMGWKPRGGNHRGQHFQSNFKPLTRLDKVDTMRDSISSLISNHKPGKTPWGGNHDTTRDSISSLISSHKPGKTPT